MKLTAGAATAGLALAAAVATAAGPWDSGQRTAERDRAVTQEGVGGADHGRTGPAPVPSAPSVLAALGASEGGDGSGGSVPAPTAVALADVLEPLLKDSALGPERTASVVDAATGDTVYRSKADTAVVPASTTKIATATAALAALGPDHRLTTRVVAEDGSGELTLVGAGDPTLTAHKNADGAASLRELADRTAAALKKRSSGSDAPASDDKPAGKKDAKDAKDGKNGKNDAGKDKSSGGIKLAYDTSLYSGTAKHPLGPNDNLAPVTALMADEGRLDDSAKGPAPRSGNPAGDAARTFADLLADRGVKIDGAPREDKAPKKAKPLAGTSSAPLSALVERMLTNSDNDIGEALARQVALDAGEPASFDGAEKAVKARLDKLGLPVSGTRFADGSGLDRDDRITAQLLTGLLSAAADPKRPELRPVLTGLPVAGFTGTLAGRYDSEGAAPGTGLVRAKTGTLTGINTLAGSVVDADGRLLVFAFTASKTVAPQAAQDALDRLASAIANCGCR
ncbi:D-alanyl-D-alanine carboxypeptidase/D-alanyl-D-alanine-endopeptidase [Streptomyces sp. YIM 130001]|uniref:D-alanyl-D-alanine carboxypeptidase/D-alanyl-D-alanine endopeptidase n=1 Tax=Streptomyces sp. YIM 130001 TaxID=2259644 RepID=UPI001F08D759|nr:D-alanyl-D-alanine carboxypeptidase/D-alanyl-D-alanine-endopeptidase [Streptomyces sp. YIM 130001]